jgi:hypothetical protein
MSNKEAWFITTLLRIQAAARITETNDEKEIRHESEDQGPANPDRRRF